MTEGLNKPKPDATTLSRVWIRRLKLNSFRNYTSANIELDKRHVVLTGENGAGKTNLLEAISFLSPGRGMRRTTYDRVAQSSDAAQTAQWAVHCDLESHIGPVELGTGLKPRNGGSDTQRRVHINGAAAKTSDMLLEYVRVLWLTPAMDGLFTGSKGDRRRFLDRLVLAIDPAHGRRVANFEKAMRSRNRLLEDSGSQTAWLDGIESQLAETAVAITFARNELVSLLRSMIGDDEDSSFPAADIKIDGTLDAMLMDGASADLEDSYRALLCNSRMRDRAAGRTLEGPHRSDLLVRHRAKNMEAALCSTGEQKALLLGLVLAHAGLVATITGMTPLLLLDEVAAHLDQNRRAALFDLIDTIGCQTWMTGTDTDLFSAIGDRAQHFSVASGSVSRES